MKSTLIFELKYIADSPEQKYGGFHPRTVQTAKRALREIRRLGARLSEHERGDRMLLDMLHESGVKCATISEGIVTLANKHKEPHEPTTIQQPAVRS